MKSTLETPQDREKQERKQLEKMELDGTSDH